LEPPLPAQDKMHADGHDSQGSDDELLITRPEHGPFAGI
jgi:hypothetical protein